MYVNICTAFANAAEIAAGQRGRWNVAGSHVVIPKGRRPLCFPFFSLPSPDLWSCPEEATMSEEIRNRENCCFAPVRAPLMRADSTASSGPRVARNGWRGLAPNQTKAQPWHGSEA